MTTSTAMDTRFWFACAAYLIPTFPLDYFWHLKTSRTRYDQLEIYRAQVLIPLGLTSMIAQALLYAWLFPKLFDRSPTEWLGSAARFGATFGLLAWCTYSARSQRVRRYSRYRAPSNLR